MWNQAFDPRGWPYPKGGIHPWGIQEAPQGQTRIVSAPSGMFESTGQIGAPRTGTTKVVMPPSSNFATGMTPTRVATESFTHGVLGKRLSNR